MKSGNLIFTEPPEDIDERWTHGAMLGGMVGFADEDLARSYFQAAALLVDQVLAGETRGQELVAPVLFLYRHGIELHLKVIVRPVDRNHSIGSLLGAFCRMIRDKYNEVVPPWITRPVGQLAEFDPDSDLFRYSKTRRAHISMRLSEGGEYWVDLRVLQRTMRNIEHAFVRVQVAEQEGLEALARLPRRA